MATDICVQIGGGTAHTEYFSRSYCTEISEPFFDSRNNKVQFCRYRRKLYKSYLFQKRAKVLDIGSSNISVCDSSSELP